MKLVFTIPLPIVVMEGGCFIAIMHIRVIVTLFLFFMHLVFRMNQYPIARSIRSIFQKEG